MRFKTNEMKTNLFVVSAIFLFFACSERNYYISEVENSLRKPNTAFEAFEDMSSPVLSRLVTKFRPDTIFHGETDEFKRILLLRHWIKSLIPIEDYGDPYPGEGYAERILDNALEGQGYHCAHFMMVQNAVMSSFGYVTRSIGAGPGVPDARFSHHGTNEIWSNQHNKWFMSDAKYDHHFEKGGIPLSALEIRDEFMKNEANDIILVKGPDRVPLDFDDEVEMAKYEFAQTYSWITWDAYADMATSWPGHKQMLIMYEDENFRNNVWIRGDRPHWVYARPEYLRLVKDKDELYFTPNTISSEAEIDGDIALIKLTSDTPGLAEYQMRKLPGDEWVKVEPEFEIELKSRKYELVFRTVNHAGVSGPDHRIIILDR
jgi:hypothetical protein